MPAAFGAEPSGELLDSASSTNRIETLQAQLRGAVASNLTDVAVAILRAEPNLSRMTNQPWQESLLVMSARHLNPELVKAFVEAGAPADPPSIQDKGPLGVTLEPLLNLWWGQWRTRPPVEDRDARLLLARYLLSHGASIFGRAGYSRSVISAAYSCGDGELVDFLLTNQLNHAACDPDGNTLIHLAAVWGRTNALRELAVQKLDLNRTNNAGLTPLQAVARIPPPSRFDGLVLGRPSPPLHSEGAKWRDEIFAQLLELGVKPDLLSFIALGWTNEVAVMLTREPQSVRNRDGAGSAPLHWAVQFGRPTIARLLIQSGAELEATNAQGQTPLDLQSTLGSLELTKLLVESGATIKRPAGARTPLHSAAERGFLDLVEYLVKKGAELEAECDGKQTPLDLAARANREKVVLFLIAQHAKLKTGGNGLTTPLHWAVAHGNTNLIFFLLDRGCDIHALNAEGRPAVHLAQAGNNFELLEFLLAHGARIDARDTNGNSALHLRVTSEKDVFPAPPTALWRWSEKLKSKPWAKRHIPANFFLPSPTRSMMEFLISHGADANATNALGQTPLHLAPAKWFEDTNAVNEAAKWLAPLWSGGAKSSARDYRGQTPLHLATACCNGPVMEALIRRGARLDERDENGNSPLHLAAQIGWLNQRHYVEDSEKERQFELLVRTGAKVSLTNYAGMTALHLVGSMEADDRRIRMGQLLLREKAPVNAKDTNGQTPLHLASGKPAAGNALGHIRWSPLGSTNKLDWLFPAYDERWAPIQTMPRLLIDAGADVNARDAQGDTPLHLAAMHCLPSVVALLVESGADRKATNACGKSAIDVAYDVVPGFTVIPFLQPPGASSEIADAARCGDLAGVKAFLDDDPKYANWTWAIGTTPLQWACNEGQYEIVELLIRTGANVNPKIRYQPEQDITNAANRCLVAFREAERRGVLPRCYLTPRSRPDQHDPPHPSIPAQPAPRELGHLDSDETLSPLQLALAGGHTNLARLLIDHGARIDPVSAAMLDRTDRLAELVGRSPNILRRSYFLSSWDWRWNNNGFWGLYSNTNEYSGTLLHHAIRAGRFKSAHLLLDMGANRFARDFSGETAHDLALKQGDPDLFQLFNDHPALSNPLLRPETQANGIWP